MRNNLALAFVTGILIALSLPPFRTGFIAYGALIPFFLLIDNKRGFELFRWSYLTGFFVFLFSLFWLWNVTKPGLAGTLLVLPFLFVLYAFLHSFILKNLGQFGYMVLPFLWTFVEYIQSFSELAFPWVHLGYSQSYYLPFIQYAEFTGIYGVSLWVVMLNVILYHLWQNRRSKGLVLKGLTAAALLILLPAVHGITVLQSKPLPELKVALVQGNIDPFEKWDQAFADRNFNLYIEKSKEVMAQSPALVIWPETANGTWLRYERHYRTRIHDLVDSTGIPLLTGSIDYLLNDSSDYEYYNSAFLFEPRTSRIQDHKKMQLVPFSERVPYREFGPMRVFYKFLYDLALGVGDYTKGMEFTLLSFYKSSEYSRPIAERDSSAILKVAVPICYESVFPDLVRRFVKKGADFLAIITNDAWFGKTTAPYQHAQIAVFRAIENRISIARTANTGVSCFIDPYGRVSQATPLFQLATLVGEIQLRKSTTFYTRHGNLFANIVSFILLMSLITGLFIRKNPEKNEVPE